MLLYLCVGLSATETKRLNPMQELDRGCVHTHGNGSHTHSPTWFQSSYRNALNCVCVCVCVCIHSTYTHCTCMYTNIILHLYNMRVPVHTSNHPHNNYISTAPIPALFCICGHIVRMYTCKCAVGGCMIYSK